MKNRVSSDLIWGLLSALLIFGVFILTLWGNSNNLDPRYLFIDEQITFYPVAKILNPSGLDEFLWLISDGADYRYGRILWNAIALIAAIPTELFGVAGQIVAARELGTVFLLSSYVLLVFGFIKTPSLRFFALLILIFLPYNSYYMSMPKPEPLMVFAISLFLYLNSKNFFSPGSPSWILVGIAFGAKISFIIPAMILFLVSSIHGHLTKKYALTSYLASICFILLGFVIANPYFLQPVLFLSYPIVIAFLLFRVLSPFTSLILLTCILVLSISLLPETGLRNFITGDLMDLSGFNHAVKEWARGTFLKVNDGSGDLNQNVYSWFLYFCKTLYPPSLLVGFLLILFSIIFFAISSKELLAHTTLDNSTIFNVLSILVMGLALLLIPMLTVKNRLWGMYFFPGLVFTSIALLSAADFYIEAIKSKKFIPSRLLSLVKIPLIALLLIVVLSYWAPEFINSFIFLGTRIPSNPQFALPPWLMGV
jgi:hypothetical protein